MSDKRQIDRRKFINRIGQITLGSLVAGSAVYSISKAFSKSYLWQIDPFKCTQCGRCETDCVLNQSAVKCVHIFDMCGYCDLCGAFFRENTKDLNTAAENQLCPTAAIERKFIEEPYYQYVIKPDLCIACGVCVKGCADFGNGSLHLQIIQNICVNCNECSIAKVCPSDAISRTPMDKPYDFKVDYSFTNKS